MVSLSDNTGGVQAGGMQGMQGVGTEQKTKTPADKLTALDGKVRHVGKELKFMVGQKGSRESIQNAASSAKKGDNVGALEHLKEAEGKLAQEFKNEFGPDTKIPPNLQKAINGLKKELAVKRPPPKVSTAVSGHGHSFTSGSNVKGSKRTKEIAGPKDDSTLKPGPPKIDPRMRRKIRSAKKDFKEGRVAGRARPGAGKLQGGKRPPRRPKSSGSRGSLKVEGNNRRLSHIKGQKGAGTTANTTTTVAKGTIQGAPDISNLPPPITTLPGQQVQLPPKGTLPPPLTGQVQTPQSKLADPEGAIKKATVLANNFSMVGTAIDELPKDVKNHPISAQVHLNNAAAAIEKGDTKEAIKELRLAEGDIAATHFGMKDGQTKDTVGDLKKEVTALRKGIEKETAPPRPKTSAPLTTPSKGGSQEGPSVKGKSTIVDKGDIGATVVDQKAEEQAKLAKNLKQIDAVANSYPSPKHLTRDDLGKRLPRRHHVQFAANSLDLAKTQLAQGDVKGAKVSLKDAQENMGWAVDRAEVRDVSKAGQTTKLTPTTVQFHQDLIQSLIDGLPDVEEQKVSDQELEELGKTLKSLDMKSGLKTEPAVVDKGDKAEGQFAKLEADVSSLGSQIASFNQRPGQIPLQVLSVQVFVNDAVSAMDKGDSVSAAKELANALSKLDAGLQEMGEGPDKTDLSDLKDQLASLQKTIDKGKFQPKVQDSGTKGQDVGKREEFAGATDPMGGGTVVSGDAVLTNSDPKYQEYLDFKAEANSLGDQAKQAEWGGDKDTYEKLSTQQKEKNELATKAFSEMSTESKAVFKLFQLATEFVGNDKIPGEGEYNKDLHKLLDTLKGDPKLSKEFADEIAILEEVVKLNDEILSDLKEIITGEKIDSKAFADLINSEKFDNYMQKMGDYAARYDDITAKLENPDMQKHLTMLKIPALGAEFIKPIQRGMRYKDIIAGMTAKSPIAHAGNFGAATERATYYAARSNKTKMQYDGQKTLAEVQSLLEGISDGKRIAVVDGKLTVKKKGFRSKSKQTIKPLGAKKMLEQLQLTANAGVRCDAQLKELAANPDFQNVMKENSDIADAYANVKKQNSDIADAYAQVYADSKFPEGKAVFDQVATLETELNSLDLKTAKEIDDQIGDLSFKIRGNKKMAAKMKAGDKKDELLAVTAEKEKEVAELKAQGKPGSDLEKSMTRVKDIKGELKAIKEDPTQFGQMMEYLEAKSLAKEVRTNELPPGFDSTVKNETALELASAIREKNLEMYQGLSRTDALEGNTQGLADLFNGLQLYTQTRIRGSQNKEELESNLSEIVDIAYALVQKGDISSASAIFAGLDVELLEDNMKLGKDVSNKLGAMKELFDTDKNSANMMAAIRSNDSVMAPPALIGKFVAAGGENAKLDAKFSAFAGGTQLLTKAKGLKSEGKPKTDIMKFLADKNKPSTYTLTEEDLSAATEQGKGRYADPDGPKKYPGGEQQAIEKTIAEKAKNKQEGLMYNQLKGFKKTMGFES